MTAPQPDLEVLLRRLDAIVTGLEREDVELEEALRLFEEGVGHLRAADQLLRTAELRVQQVLDTGSTPSITDLTTDDET